MPFALSAAITAAIAPLLFVQSIYQQEFYTAHLLLYRRWLVVLPALIVAFYSLYLLKSRSWQTGSHAVRAVVALIAFVCIAFTGSSWMQNHQLMLDHERWTTVYLESPFSYWDERGFSRAGLVILSAAPVMCAVLGWQLRYSRRSGPPLTPQAVNFLARLAVGTIFAAVAVAVWHYWALGALGRNIWRAVSLPYLVLVFSGVAVSLYAWVVILRQRDLRVKWLAWASAGLCCAAVGGLIARESIRLATVNLEHLEKRMAEVSNRGVGVFLICVLLSAALIGLSVRVVQRGLQRSQAHSSEGPAPGAGRTG